MNAPRIGVLALQGDVREHLLALEAAGAQAERVRRPEELARVDALVLPGGESTTMAKLARTFDVLEPLRQRIKAGLDGRSRDFYIRQLRDWKFSLDPEMMVPDGMRMYGALCGWTLARAHARSGDRIALAAYLGNSDVFDRAIAKFAAAYADQNERDHQALVDAVKSGRITAEQGL